MHRQLALDDLLDNRVVTQLVTSYSRTSSWVLSESPCLETEGVQQYLDVLEEDRLQPMAVPPGLSGIGCCGETFWWWAVAGGKTTLYQAGGTPLATVDGVCDGVWYDGTWVVVTKKIEEGDRRGEVVPLRYDGGASWTGRLLAVYDRQGSCHYASGRDQWVESVAVDFAGARLALALNGYAKAKTVTAAVDLLSLKTMTVRRLLDHRYRIGEMVFFDRALFLNAVDVTVGGRNDNKRLYRLSLEGGTIAPFGEEAGFSDERPSVTTDARYGQGPAFFSDGTALYQVLNGPKGTKIHRIDREGTRSLLDPKLHTIDHLVPQKEGFLLVGLAGQNRQTLFRYNPVGKLLTPLSRWHQWTSVPPNIARPAPLGARKTDGTSVTGWVLPPGESFSGQKQPAVLVIHGGPKMRYTPAWSFDLQLLAAHGYHVLICNPRGSDGERAPHDQIRGQFAEKAEEDLLLFLEKALETYEAIDPERLAVLGGSYGGYMVNHLITRTSRFRCAISERGISDLRHAFGTSDIGHQFATDYLGGKAPYEAPAVYDRLSPLRRSHLISTPLLLIHGEKDQRCAYTESLQLFTELKVRGVSTRMVLFPEEGHSLPVSGRPSARIRRMEEILTWLETYV